MELVEGISVVRRNVVLIVVAIAVCVLAALAYSLVSKPVYTSEAEMLFSAEVPAGGTAQEQLAANNLVLQQASTYQTLATTPIVLQPVIDTLGLDATPADIVPQVEANLGSTSSLLSIVVTSDTPQEAVDLASAIVAQIRNEVGNPAAAFQSPAALRTSIVQEASVPLSPSSPIIPLNLAIGFGVGLVLAFIVVSLREILNTRIRGVRDAARAVSVPILSRISHTKPLEGGSLISGNIPSDLAEQFRMLRLRLDSATDGRDPVVVVASPGRNEGKSLVASNLALALASTGKKVVLIDANLRSPELAEAFVLSTEGGVADVILGSTSMKDVKLNAVWPELSIVTTSAVDSGAGEFLASPKMAAIVNKCSSLGDVVVIDAGPVLDSADGGTIARLATTLVLVVRARSTKTSALQGAIASIQAVDGELAGVIVNDVPVRGPDSRV